MEEQELELFADDNLRVARLTVLSALGDVGIIDGDALLEMMFEADASLLDWSHGGQLVHLVDLVERFLLQFVRRNVKLQVVFFASGAWLWRDNSTQAFARRVIILHLQQLDSPLIEVIVHTTKWNTDAWPVAMAGHDPNWVLSFDGTVSSREHARRYFRAFADHHLFRLAANVVMVPGLEFRGNDIEAWVRLPAPLGTEPSADTELVTGDEPWFQHVEEPLTPLPAGEAVAQALKAVKDAAVRQALESFWKYRAALPLEQRASTELQGEADPKVVDGLKQLATALHLHASSELLELLDGRFVHRIIKEKLDLKEMAATYEKKAKEAEERAKKRAEKKKLGSDNDNNADKAKEEAAPAADDEQKEAAAAADDAAAAVPDSWENAAADAAEPIAESWDAAPADSWADFDISAITVKPAGEEDKTEEEMAAEAEAARQKEEEKKRKDKERADARQRRAEAKKNAAAGQDQLAVEQLGKDVLLGESRKRIDKKSKREMKGEQRAAHIDKLQADSLTGRYVQQHVITLDRKQVKVSTKQLKIKEQAAVNERARQENAWKDFLQSNDISDTSRALQFLADNEFQQDLEFRILLEIAERSPQLDLAMPVLAELVFRGCPEKERLAGLAARHGFPELATQLRGDVENAPPDRKWVRRQLLEMSELLPREQGEPDSRVKHFRPDPWQRQLLDHVDEGRSCVVVAPTSAGKTFIQYYVMEKVLREDDSNVVVYVCPTKALCHQVMAGVNARYEKSYPPGSAAVLCGIFLKDRRHRAESCQILVTVPECLDILLLSPTKAGQNWAKKIKWILFDEVHTINDPHDGPVWERILQLTTCPFLALSATVGQPEAFRSWLSGTRRQRVELIVHSERYNDLRLFVTGRAEKVDMPAAEEGKEQMAQPTCQLLPLHPCTFVTTEQLAAERAFPSLAAFEAKDAYNLWEAMVLADPAQAGDLTPDEFFKEPVISRNRSKQWGQELKARLVSWSVDQPELCNKVLSTFNSRLTPEQVLETGADDEEAALFELTQKLLADGPALLFCHRRGFTEEMVEYYVRRLEQMQAAAAPSLKKQKAHDRRAEAIAKQKKQKEKRSRNKKEQEEAERYGDVSAEIVIPVEEQYPVEFTLRRRDRKGLLGKEDREELIRSLRYKTRWPDTHPLVQGLRRGIGCHHEGLPHRYRVAVELMFRTGDITVVFATQTLAQGIHAPARSVVLVHDLPTFLTPTSLRQMTGRAGRRGYDLMGQVVFYGVRYDRIRQLLRSRVPQMRGGFPLSPSLVLRLTMVQNSGASSQELIDAQVEQLLSQPLLAQGGQRPQLPTLLHHYSSAHKTLLVRLGLLTPSQDKYQWLAALGSHLSYLDPSNLAFIFCFGQRLFHRFLDVEDPALPEPQEQLLMVISCILRPIRVHKSLEERYRGKVGTPYVSQVVQPVPDWLLEQIRAFNKLVMSVFTRAARSLPEPQDHRLPLSRCPVGPAPVSSSSGGGDDDEDDDEDDNEDREVQDCVSVFARTSGVTESKLTSLDRLVYTARSDLCVDHTAVSVVPELTHCNSFVSDFFRQLIPDVDSIIRDNRLPLAWYKLSEFSQTLRVIAVAMSKLYAHHETVMDSNIYRMLSDDRDPIDLHLIAKSEADDEKAGKRVCNAFIHLSDEFTKKFGRTKK